ncbi:thermonuclease family protein [Synechococcus sp. CBW1107]|uniref:thermonuclease family protein n=1 Tax=Synechococcus sp. CBW1107 TaxID=2789857 RepID=UPI002AD1D2F4|nr:thermonuclease family protein [Synechococcus sp. CBW1107]CAK6701086.1 hypothetical protein ICNINCKA_02995 [Synechococcus sp. CBW1107]
MKSPAPSRRWLLVLCFLAILLVCPQPAVAQRCSNFRTCEEAMRSLKSGNTRTDGDGDGIPCEALCKGGKGGSPPPRGPSSPRPKATLISGRAGLISVGDGDTIRVRASSGESVTVRLDCIDAPETAQGASDAAATQTLRQLVGSGPLKIRPQTIDRYGRTVTEVYANERNLNVEMVRLEWLAPWETLVSATKHYKYRRLVDVRSDTQL